MAQRTDEPGYTPDADIRRPQRHDTRRDGTLGGLLIFLLPMLILLAAGVMWWTNVGLTGPAVDGLDLVQPGQDGISTPTPGGVSAD